MMSSITEVPPATHQNYYKSLFTINEAKEEEEIIHAAHKVISDIRDHGLYSNIKGFVYYYSGLQEGTFTHENNPLPDGLVDYCGSYRSCVEDAVFVARCLYREYQNLRETLSKIISFVITNSNGTNTNHAALMLEWADRDGNKKAIVLDVEPAKRALIYPPRQPETVFDQLDIEKYEREKTKPEREFHFSEPEGGRIALEVNPNR